MVCNRAKKQEASCAVLSLRQHTWLCYIPPSPQPTPHYLDTRHIIKKVGHLSEHHKWDTVVKLGQHQDTPGVVHSVSTQQQYLVQAVCMLPGKQAGTHWQMHTQQAPPPGLKPCNALPFISTTRMNEPPVLHLRYHSLSQVCRTE
jgi:hypothetical protein